MKTGFWSEGWQAVPSEAAVAQELQVKDSQEVEFEGEPDNSLCLPVPWLQ